MQLRPSSLPKLALCGQYTGKPGASAEAARGTIIDGAFRSFATVREDQWPESLNEMERQTIRWAVRELDELADGAYWTAEDAECHLDIPGMPNGGTVDALCLERRWSADIKTGQHRDYCAQMAAYALGGMEKTGYDQWTTFILWIDDPQIQPIVWTRAKAEATVAEALAKLGKPPEPNDYCGWCAKELTCTARLQLMQQAQVSTSDRFLQILEDPERLGAFLTAAKVFEKFQTAAEETAKSLITAGTPVPGWKLGTPRTSQAVSLAELWQSDTELSALDLLQAAGSVTLKKAEELAGKPISPELVKTMTTKPPLTKCN